MKRVMAILGLALVMSAASISSINAGDLSAAKKCKIKKVSGKKTTFKGKRCDRVIRENDTYYYY